MSIGVEFILKASTGAFKSGLAAANNAVRDLKKSVAGMSLGGGISNLLGVGGVIAGFRAATNHAQELRDEAAKVGKTVDANVASVARFGDGIDGLKKGFADFGILALSVFTRAGDAMRHFFQNTTAEQEAAAEKMVEVTGKAADEAEARLRKSREANSPEKQAAAQAKLDDAEVEAMIKGTDAQKKLVRLTNERADLQAKLRNTPTATVAYKELQAALLKNEVETRDASEGFDKEAAQKKEQTDRERARTLDKIAPTVEELAAQETGGWVEANDPRLRARQALEAEKWAREAGQRGDIREGLRLQGKADELRKGLSDVTAQSQTLTPDSAKAAVAAALEKTNEEIRAVKEALGGIIKAGK